MTCEMRCRLSAAHLAVDRGKLAEAAAQLPPVENLLRAAIECGAMVDPWNILGFNGQYSLFPAIENSVHDHRVDELLDMVGDIFMLYVRIYQGGGRDRRNRVGANALGKPRRVGAWWDKFAAGEIDSIDGISGQATLESAQHVAAALAGMARRAAPRPAIWPFGGNTSNSSARPNPMPW